MFVDCGGLQKWMQWVSISLIKMGEKELGKLNITKYYALAHACFTEFKLGLQQLPLNVPMQ